MQIQQNRQLLERASALIPKKAEEFINKAIETTLSDCKLGVIQLVDGNHDRRASAGERQVCPNNSLSLSIYILVRIRVLKGYPQGSKVLTVKTVGHAEEFLRLSQHELHSALNGLKSEYVTTIRKLAEKAKERRFNTLRDAIKHLDPRLQPELREEIVSACLFNTRKP